MQPNQPKTTLNRMARDASVQIEDDAPQKQPLIRYGAAQEILDRHPEWITKNGEETARLDAETASVMALCQIIEELTSTDKASREYGKARVRKLVKIGTEVEAKRINKGE